MIFPFCYTLIEPRNAVDLVDEGWKRHTFFPEASVSPGCGPGENKEGDCATLDLDHVELSLHRLNVLLVSCILVVYY